MIMLFHSLFHILRIIRYIYRPIKAVTVQLIFIYTVAMKRVYSATVPVTMLDKPFAVWNGLDKSGKRLTGGVYIFVCKSGNSIKKGKFVVYND
jgi:hypothetical protein